MSAVTVDIDLAKSVFQGHGVDSCGTGFPSAPVVKHGAEGVVGQNVATLVLAVSPGDFLELVAWRSAGGAINVGAHSQSWLGIEVVE